MIVFSLIRTSAMLEKIYWFQTKSTVQNFEIYWSDLSDLSHVCLQMFHTLTVRYLYTFATYTCSLPMFFATYTLSLPVIFATRHNISHPDSGKDIGIILKLNGGDMIQLYIYFSACYGQMNNIP